MSKLPLFLVAFFLVCSLSLFGNLNAIQGESMSNPVMLMNTHSYWYEFWNGINWSDWKWIIIIGAIFMFFLVTLAYLKKWVEA